MLKGFSRRAPRRPAEPLPPQLAERLRTIARREQLCRDFDRSWPALLGGTEPLDAARREGLERHLGACPRCAGLAEALLEMLASAPAVAPAAPPPGLDRRLRAIARLERRPLPFYLGDVRFAAAASWILAFALTLLLGGSDAAVERTNAFVGQPVERASRELGELRGLGRYGEDLLKLIDGRTRQVGDSLGSEWRRLGADLSELPAALGAPSRERDEPNDRSQSTPATEDGDRER